MLASRNAIYSVGIQVDVPLMQSATAFACLLSYSDRSKESDVSLIMDPTAPRAKNRPQILIPNEFDARRYFLYEGSSCASLLHPSQGVRSYKMDS